MKSKEIVQVLGGFVKESRLQRFRDALDSRSKGVTLVCENLDCPHNISAILRTCDGFGLHNVDLIESSFSKGAGFSLNRDVSKGCEKYLNISRFGDTWSWLERSQNQTIVSTELGAPDISTINWSNIKFPISVVLGNEIRGVSGLVRQNAALKVSLPAVGMVQVERK